VVEHGCAAAMVVLVSETSRSVAAVENQKGESCSIFATHSTTVATSVYKL
jgi:hypothetical protein